MFPPSRERENSYGHPKITVPISPAPFALCDLEQASDLTNGPLRIDREPRDRADPIHERGHVKRKRPRVPPIDGDADDHRTDQAAEVSKRVHEAGDDARMSGADVQAHRPTRAEREVG